MNTQTGKVYHDPNELKLAQANGEPVVAVSPLVAEAVEIGMRVIGRKRRREAERAAKKVAKKTYLRVQPKIRAGASRNAVEAV